MAFRERLLVPAWWWLIGGLVASGMALAVWSYLGPVAGIGATVLFVGAVVAALTAYGVMQIVVDERGVRVGANRVEWAWLGECEPLDATGTARLLGECADPRAFLATRPYVKTAVRLQIDDAADPHPYWVVSTRQPAAFAAAYEQARTSL